jgi:hypothetical protein
MDKKTLIDAVKYAFDEMPEDSLSRETAKEYTERVVAKIESGEITTSAGVIAEMNTLFFPAGERDNETDVKGREGK